MIKIITTIKFGSTYYNIFTMGVCSNLCVRSHILNLTYFCPLATGVAKARDKSFISEVVTSHRTWESLQLHYHSTWARIISQMFKLGIGLVIVVWSKFSLSPLSLGCHTSKTFLHIFPISIPGILAQRCLLQRGFQTSWFPWIFMPYHGANFALRYFWD